eukprot:scaffold105664_cov72-Phaeocystis_antarctica.AAC.2
MQFISEDDLLNMGVTELGARRKLMAARATRAQYESMSKKIEYESMSKKIEVLTMAILTMAILTMARLTMARLTMARLTMARLTVLLYCTGARGGEHAAASGAGRCREQHRARRAGCGRLPRCGARAAHRATFSIATL